jgi:catechol 2,3-dioxygenase-like lactoylglutathione lyase family enzyme
VWFDHVAIEVTDFDRRIELMVDELGLTLRRTGRLVADPDRRIAMLADERGVKIELVEAAADRPAGSDRLLHLAFDAHDPPAVDRTYADLLAAGSTPTTAPRRFEPARSYTASVDGPGGGSLQFVAYDADSPDAASPPAAPGDDAGHDAGHDARPDSVRAMP